MSWTEGRVPARDGLFIAIAAGPVVLVGSVARGLRLGVRSWVDLGTRCGAREVHAIQVEVADQVMHLSVLVGSVEEAEGAHAHRVSRCVAMVGKERYPWSCLVSRLGSATNGGTMIGD